MYVITQNNNASGSLINHLVKFQCSLGLAFCGLWNNFDNFMCLLLNTA